MKAVKKAMVRTCPSSTPAPSTNGIRRGASVPCLIREEGFENV